jgi:protein disulfide-isomerase
MKSDMISRQFKFIAFTALIMVFFSDSGVLAQPVKPVDQSEYKAHAEGWLVDINEAYEISRKTGKPIMANFTGSDWCGWCKKLKAEVFDKDEFKKWADKNVVLVELDFPRRFQLPENIKQQNYSLQQAFKVTGYPTIWVFFLNKNESGQFTIEALGKTGYVNGVSAFTSGVDDMISNAKTSAQ